MKTKSNKSQKHDIGYYLCFSYMAIADNSAQIQQLRQRLEDYELEIQNLRIEMGAYILTNPKASAAVIASGGGLAGILEQKLDNNTRVVLLDLGLIGINGSFDIMG